MCVEHKLFECTQRLSNDGQTFERWEIKSEAILHDDKIKIFEQRKSSERIMIKGQTWKQNLN